MTSQGTAIGVAFFFGFVAQYVLYLFATLKKQSQIEAILNRSQKFYLFGTFCLLSIHFVNTFSAVLAWFTFLGYAFYVWTGLKEDSKPTTALALIIFIGFSTVWWLGQTIIIFDTVIPYWAIIWENIHTNTNKHLKPQAWKWIKWVESLNKEAIK